MNPTIWKQVNSRWGNLPYPTRGCTVSGAGCGLLACTHVAMEQDSKADWTPKDLRGWMVSKGFAVAGQGTKWEGITQTLKHIGHEDVVRIYNDPMSEAFKELNKGDRIGVILFKKGSAPNGLTWTSIGHYVAFTGYKVKDGKHYFYIKDSGGRNHNGWFTYERSMKGLVCKMWIVKRIPKGAYTGTLPTKTVKKGSKGKSVKALQGFLNWDINAGLKIDGKAGDKTVKAIKRWQKKYGLKKDGHFGPKCRAKAKSIVEADKKAVTKSTPSVKKKETMIMPNQLTPQQKMVTWAKKVAADNSWHYLKWSSSDKKTHDCPVCKKRGKGKYHGWNCIGLCFAAWRHGAGIKCKCSCHVMTGAVAENMLKLSHSKALALAQSRIGIKSIKVLIDKNGLKQSQLEPGDICMRFDGSKCKHFFLYIGNGKMADARGSNGKIPNDKQISIRKAQSCKIAIRYTGK